MVKSIQVTGREFKLPEEAQGLKHPYEAIADSLIGYDNYPELKRKLKGDLQWAQKILEKGPEDNYSGFSHSAAMLADSINEPLELILNSKKPSSMGSHLGKGKIVIRGSLGKETGRSMRGGYLFVDGDVDQIKHPVGGVIYINGDVGEVEELYHGILIVAGSIKNVSKKAWLNWDNPVKPSPFVFTTNPIELFGYKGDKGVETPIEYSFVRSEEELRGWSPEDLESRALNLCKKRLINELNKKEQLLTSITAIDKAIEFFKMHIDGFHQGYGDGYHAGTLDHLPCYD